MPDTIQPNPDYPVTMVIHPNLLVADTPAGRRYQRVKGPPWREFELQYNDRNQADRDAFDAFWAAHELAPVLFDQPTLERAWTVRFAGDEAEVAYALARPDSHSWRVELVEAAPAAVASSGSETDLIPSVPDYVVAQERWREIIAQVAEDRTEQRAGRRAVGRVWRLGWRELSKAEFLALETFWLERRDRAFTFAAPDTGMNHVVLVDSDFRHVEVGLERHSVSFDIVERT